MPAEAQISSFIKDAQVLLMALWGLMPDMNGEFMKALLGTIVGAVAGSGTILFVEQRTQQKMLADFNSALAILTGHLNRLIFTKRQQALPMFNEIYGVQNRNFTPSGEIKTQEVIVKLDQSMMQLLEVDWDMLLPITDLAAYAVKRPNAVTILMKACEAMSELKMAIKYKNSLVSEIMENTRRDEKEILRYLGCNIGSGMRDNRLMTASENFLNSNNTALFYVNKSISEINILAEQCLPKRMHKKIAKFSIIDEGAKEMLPPDDYITGV